MTGWDDDFQLTDDTVQQMIDLLRDEAPVSFIAQGLKFHYVHPSLVHYFSGPVLSGEPNMETSLNWITAAVRVERLETIIAEHRAGMVGRLSTLAEVMAYLVSVARARLLHPDWIAIYGHVAHTTLARHALRSENSAVLHPYEPSNLTPAEQERLVALQRDIRQAVARLARRREIIWPGQSFSAPTLNQPSFRQLAERQGKERSVLCYQERKPTMPKKKKQKNRRRSRPAPSSNSPPRKRRLPAPQMPAGKRQSIPRQPLPSPVDNPYVNKIVHLIEEMASLSGITEWVLLKDWCGMLESGLQMWPENMRAMAIDGRFIEDPPHIQEIFAQARERYLRASETRPAVYRRMQESFSEAFAILLDSAAPGLDTYGQQTDLNPDVVGQVFVTCLQPGPASPWWLYFPGWPDALAAARQAIPDGDELVYLELAQAALKARCDGHAVELEPGVNWQEWFQTVRSYVDPPLTIGPPLIDSSVMMLAVAACFPDWAVKSGLVRFIWEPADPLLRQFANINQMLFSLNGYLMAHYQALADIHAHLEQQADEPAPSPEATPAAARLYQADPPPEAETEEPETAPPPQSGGQTFADLFKKK